MEILSALADAVPEAKRAIDELPIEEAQQEVVDAIRALQDKAEELLAEVRLPEGLRPVIEQLTAELREVDLEAALLGPVDEALADFNVLDELGLTDLVRDVQGVLSNLVPAQIATELRGRARRRARRHPPRSARTGCGRPSRASSTTRRTRSTASTSSRCARSSTSRSRCVLEGFDQLRPSVLLRPLLDAYDELIGAAGLGDPVAATAGPADRGDRRRRRARAAADRARSTGSRPGSSTRVQPQLPQPGADRAAPGRRRAAVRLPARRSCARR